MTTQEQSSIATAGFAMVQTSFSRDELINLRTELGPVICCRGSAS